MKRAPEPIKLSTATLIKCHVCGSQVYRVASGILRHTRQAVDKTDWQHIEHEQCPGTTRGARP